MNQNDMVAAVEGLFPAAQYTIDYTIKVTNGVAAIQTWNNSLGTQPTIDQIQASLTAIQLVGYKSQQAAQIESSYQNAIYNTPIAYMGTTFFTDQTSQFMILGAAYGYNKAGAVPTGFVWKDAAGALIPMTLAQLDGLVQAVLAQSNTCFGKRESLLASITAATTVAAVQAIAWS